jgi:hypothetical protein
MYGGPLFEELDASSIISIDLCINDIMLFEELDACFVINIDLCIHNRI